MKKLALLFVISLLFIGCANQYQAVKISFNSTNISVIAEKADTEEKMAKGLMWREYLGEKEGMLFYFNQSGYHAFWMANTPIQLEAIFVSEDFRIVDIVEMEPCDKRPPEPCPIYLPGYPAKYVLEVNQNFSKKYGIKAGDKIDFGD